jgi:hypothetical protein
VAAPAGFQPVTGPRRFLDRPKLANGYRSELDELAADGFLTVDQEATLGGPAAAV